MQVAVALLGNDALYDALLRVVVEGDGVGMVFGLGLLEVGAAVHLVGRVAGAVGVQGLVLEVDFHAVGVEGHVVVVDMSFGVEVGAPRLEVHRHRVASLVLYHAAYSIFRHSHQGVDIALGCADQR